MDEDKVYTTDCVAGLAQLKDVDLIIADPPYVISRPSNFHTMKDRKNPRTGTDLASWDQDFDNKAWLKAAANCLKEGGSLLVFNDFRKATTIYEECPLVYKDTLAWLKTNPMPRNRDRRYVPDLEMIQWYIKPGKWTFNRKSSYESCVLRFASESGGGFKRYHPTQKPVKLIEKLILTHSNEGDLVVDPFLGSGTTALASLLNKRHFIGFEVNEEYSKIAEERIKRLSH